MDKLQQNYQYFEEINLGIIRKVGRGLKILDIGCGYGHLGEAIKKNKNEVYGIDISPVALEVAKKRLDFAFLADITKPETLPVELKGKVFDIVLLADILEHLYDPKVILVISKTFLKEDGRLILSMPNVANWATRLKLLFGCWNYTPSGVLDRTHIRFFTLSSLRRLLKAVDYEIISVSVTPYFLRAFAEPIRNMLFPDSKNKTPSDPTTLMKSPFYKFYIKILYPVECFISSMWKRLFAFQFIIVAKPVSKKMKRN